MHTFTAPRSFSPVEVIGKETPFIQLLYREYKDEACESCFKSSPNLKSCKECLSMKYCSKICQKKDWKNHRLECKYLKNLPSGKHIDLTRLVGNIILKIKDKDWKTIKSNVLGRDVTFDDIEPYSERIPNSYRHSLYSSVKECVRRYIGDENMPNEDAFKIIFEKIHQCLSNGVKAPSLNRTIFMLIGLAFYQNECIPNCHIIWENSVCTIRAIKKIEKSEKLSVVSKDILDDPPTFEIINGPCNCTDCKLPYGESVLSKITDEHKASAVIIASQCFINMWYTFPVVQGMPEMKCIVDDILQKQEGVLGDTNALHLKLLVIKCFYIDSDPLEKKRNLLKLEKNVVAAFGEYFEQLPRIYGALAEVSFSLGDSTEGFHYFEKIRRLVTLMKPS